MTKYCKHCAKFDHNTNECWGPGTVALDARGNPPAWPPDARPAPIDMSLVLRSGPKTSQSLLDKLMARVKEN